MRRGTSASYNTVSISRKCRTFAGTGVAAGGETGSITPAAEEEDSTSVDAGTCLRPWDIHSGSVKNGFRCQFMCLTNPILLDDALGRQTSQIGDSRCYIGWRQRGKLGKGVDPNPAETALDDWAD